jgi:hypothetical protein
MKAKIQKQERLPIKINQAWRGESSFYERTGSDCNIQNESKIVLVMKTRDYTARRSQPSS